MGVTYRLESTVWTFWCVGQGFVTWIKDTLEENMHGRDGNGSLIRGNGNRGYGIGLRYA